MIKYLIFSFTLAFCTYSHFSIVVETVDPLSIEAFYRLAAKNAVIFDTRI